MSVSVRETLAWITNTREGLARAVVKTAMYRVFMVMITTVIAFAFTDDGVASAGIGLTTNFIKTFTYFGYERIWARVIWGYQE